MPARAVTAERVEELKRGLPPPQSSGFATVLHGLGTPIASCATDFDGVPSDEEEHGSKVRTAEVVPPYMPHHPVWILLEPALLSSNRPCPPGCRVHLCLSGIHRGQRWVGCDQRASNSRCFSCTVAAWVVLRTGLEGNLWGTTTRSIERRDALKARLRLGPGRDKDKLRDPRSDAVSEGQRVALSSEYVSEPVYRH